MKALTRISRWIMICIFLSIPAAIAIAAIAPQATDSGNGLRPGQDNQGLRMMARSRNQGINPADIIAGVILDKSAQGYIRIAGVQIAWGRENVQGMKSKSMSFPASFSEIPAVTLGPEQSGGARFSLFIESTTKTGFTLRTSSLNNRATSWIAVGTWE